MGDLTRYAIDTSGQAVDTREEEEEEEEERFLPARVRTKMRRQSPPHSMSPPRCRCLVCRVADRGRHTSASSRPGRRSIQTMCARPLANAFSAATCTNGVYVASQQTDSKSQRRTE